jgi:hypothetical protein
MPVQPSQAFPTGNDQKRIQFINFWLKEKWLVDFTEYKITYGKIPPVTYDNMIIR